MTIYQAREGAPRTLGAGTSDGDGHFSIGLPADDGGGIRYAVARKGKAVELAAVIGPETPPSIALPSPVFRTMSVRIAGTSVDRSSPSWPNFAVGVQF